jgi:hypothetical protein
MTPHPEYGFRRTPESHITWTTEDAARRVCFDYGYTLLVRDVSTPRVARQRR